MKSRERRKAASARARGFSRSCAFATLAWISAIAPASAQDDGLPGVAAASEVLQVAAMLPDVDFTPIGAANPQPAARIEPPLPPDVSADAPRDAGVADRIPFVLDALVGSPRRFKPLGAGDWRAAREAVRALYVARAFRPIWTDGFELNAYGRSLLAQLRRAGDDGLDLRGVGDLRPRSSTAQDAAEAEVGLSIAAVVYALEASGARLSPRALSPLVTPDVPVADPLQALVDLAVALDPGERLQAFNPPQAGYRRLRERLAELAPSGATALAEAPEANLALTRFDTQARPIGHAGRFASALPVPVRLEGVARAGLRARLQANMEMWRWQPRDLGADRIEINVPDFALKLYRGDRETDEMRVIVGKPDTPTPIFSNQIRYLLINPIWRVPDSIVRKEMLPKAGGDASYLQSRGFNVKWIGGRIFVEQPPGEANALGRLLFMFPNEHAVYLHDTPSHALFRNPDRAFSHGCVRVETPLRLASEVMGGEAKGWPEAKVESFYGPNERWIFLPAPLPIHIEYFTEYVDDRGALQERGDVYGLAAKVAAGLSSLGQD